MAVISTLLKLSLGFSALVTASPIQERGQIQARGTISNADIVGFAEAVPANETGVLYKAYQPFLKVVNGCVPFPGVDAAGDTK